MRVKQLKNMMIKILIVAFVLTIYPKIVVKADDDGNSVQIGIEYVGNYSGTGSPVQKDINTAFRASRGDVTIMIYNTNWGLKYIWGDSNVWEKDFKSSGLGGMIID